MIRICAWCRQEGKSGILGTSPGEVDGPESHGICHAHGLSLRQAFTRNLAHPPIATTLSPSPVSF
jgi:hypothetical protein